MLAAWPHETRRAGRRPGRIRPLAAAARLLLAAAPPARAVDGRADVSASRQSGNAGADAYRTEALVENYSLGERLELSRSWLLNLDLLTRREQLEGTTAGLRTYTRTTSLLPAFSLNFRRDRWHGALNGRALRREWRGTGLESRRDENVQFGAWARGDFDLWELELRLQEQASWREQPDGERENREHTQTVNVRRFFGGGDELRYSFTRSRQELPTFGNEVLYRTHQAQYRGDHAFADGRGRVGLDALVSHFRQDDRRPVAGGRRLLLPVWGGYTLDDTPGYQDPLEPEPVRDERLHDRDRDAPTGVDLGSAAPAVQQFGGDWRNIIYDFGETETISAAVLYVDTRVGFPGLISWSVHASDDPEGRDWGTEIAPSAYTMVYEDLADGRQGWLLTFDEPVRHRRLKIVNRKAGETEPSIRVTEWEVYGPADATAETTDRTLRSLLRGSVRYDLVPAVELQYYTELDDRRFLDEDERLFHQVHVVGATWRFGGWSLLGQHQVNRQEAPSGRDVDATTDIVSLSSVADRDLTWRFSWRRTDDRSFTARHLTHTAGADVNWRPAPRLTVNQKVTYGVRDARDVDGTAHSWALVTTLRGDIRPSMYTTLRRADRWTDLEAGTGFTTFNDTDWMLNWAILPLVTLTSQVDYKVRDDEQWILRHTLAWTPLPGGSLDLRFYGSDYQDTRGDYLRRGVGATVIWKPRSRLRLEAGAEQTLVKENADRNTPVNLNARGSWTF